MKTTATQFNPPSGVTGPITSIIVGGFGGATANMDTLSNGTLPYGCTHATKTTTMWTCS